MKKKFIAKLVIIGDPAVGKTSLKTYLTRKKFDPGSQTTLGADITRYAMDIDDESQIVMQIWDIAGQTRDLDVSRKYYLGSKGAILVFDITRDETFMNIQKWLGMLRNFMKVDIPILLIGNKIDLKDGNSVTHERIVDYTKRLSDWLGMEVPFALTSAKTGENVEESFFTIGNNMLLRTLKE